MRGVLLCLLLTAVPAHAAVGDYVGKRIVDVRVASTDVNIDAAALLEVVETRVGSPLEMIDVRESIAHLFGLGLYQDVQVDATLKGDGVALIYNVIPALRVRRILFEGTPGIDESDLRRRITERHGVSPSAVRANATVDTLRTLYRDRGYPKAHIDVRVDGVRNPSNAAMVYTIKAGAKARVGAIDVQGTPRAPVPAVLSALNLRSGDEYDGIEVDRQLTRYADDLRSQGYYGARAVQLPRYADDESVVNLVISIEPGPRVEIAFEGDPLAAADRERLVPIAREHSVDEDLLEDSKFGIERHFRERGYCNPRAEYQRAESAGVLRITFTVTRGPQCMVESTDLNGNSTLTSAELAPLMVTKAGLPFSDSTLASDALRVQGYYRQRGFSAVKVTTQVERREPKSGSEFVRVRFVVEEGIRSIVESVSFQGSNAVGADLLRKVVRSTPGQPYFEPQIAADADRVAIEYLNRGYPDAIVQAAPKGIGDGSKVEIVFRIQEGRQILIDHVLIVGNQRTARETILREVQLKSGQPLSQRDEDDTRSRLTALGLFRRVDISYLQLPGDMTQRDVVITVDEAPVTTIDYGGGLEGGKRLVRSSEEGPAVEEFQVAPRGFFQVSRRNLFGKDRSISLFTRVSFRPKGVSALRPDDVADAPIDDGGYGFNEYLTRVTYGERRILGFDADATVSAGIEQAVRPSFDFNRRGASATVTRRMSRNFAISGRYGIDHTRLLNIKSDFAAQPQIDRLFPQVRLSSVSGSLIRDTRNDSIEPSGGSLLGTDSELAARGIGSQVGFFKTFVQGFTYHQLPRARATVVVFGARVGLAAGFPRTVLRDGQTIVVDDIPASERFYAGGDTTVRGFTLDRLGTPETIDEDDFPKGGHGLVVLNAEARIPVRGGLGAVVFIDGGNVFDTVDHIDFSKLRASVGFGLRYRSPVGPIRVDIGFNLDPRMLPSGKHERRAALHISLGQAF